ncbi:MAG TPA: hypothetical protein HA282_00080 [Nanoarchaeota archaeon]|nr:hypothetical protein [Candidatus Pacearchaeota archaeon]HIH17311.1 hypothetical protein [Nanoarchaeota archaeon]HIH34425.1 hypothetical protein [Nanoarchaeota archaeon]HIH51598.1 hypothetical protein [Nanoarchaeota archaeon]HIH65598.1 hypothetical protein [Nanoarchaeota archaeon]
MAPENLDDLFERSTIALPRQLGLKEAEDLLSYLAMNLPGRISYTANYIRNSMPDGSTQDGGVKLGGMIVNDSTFAVDSFESIHDGIDTTKIAAIRFSPIPGYELSEHRPENIQLWDDVRALIEKY